MNYTEINLDLQSVAKRIYDSLLYRSSFYKMLNPNYIGELRTAGTPMIEVLQSADTTVNVRETREIATALTPALQGYKSVKVDLTELPMDYSIRIPVLVAGSNFVNVLEDAMDKKDQAVAKAIDTYGFGKLESEVTNEAQWNPSTQQDYIDTLNTLKATLFNKNVYEGFRLALSATENAKLIAALTSILKFETEVGVKGVDMGVVNEAYGIEIFPVNDTVIGDAKGYFFNNLAVVGDSFFDSMVTYNGNYPGFPGYFVIESNILFGAEIVEQNAILKLVEEISA
jgi:3D (Asp-Asp-Asp) domain-containing protein